MKSPHTTICQDGYSPARTPPYAGRVRLPFDFYKPVRTLPRGSHAIYPERYPSADCPACGLRATLDHVLWECEAIGSSFSEDRWAALLGSPELNDQTLAVQSARDRAVKLGLAVPTWD